MSAQGQAGGGSGVTADVSEVVMLVVVLVLFIVIVLALFFYLYAKRRMGRRSTSFVVPSERVGPHPGRGLDAVVLRSLPATVYRAADYKEGVECAVCLTELSEGDEVRVLPKCSHGFHLPCIDTWFRSDTTCPVCRAPVITQLPPEEQINAGNSPRGPSSYAGSSVPEKPVGDGADAHIIEIPSRVTEGAPSPLPARKPALEESKSPAPSTNFTTLTRLLVLGNRAASPFEGPNGADIEQGRHGASTPTPRDPTNP